MRQRNRACTPNINYNIKTSYIQDVPEIKKFIKNESKGKSRIFFFSKLLPGIENFSVSSIKYLNIKYVFFLLNIYQVRSDLEFSILSVA